MTLTKIPVQEIQGEIADMLNVCFEGEVETDFLGILLTLPNGQRFRLCVTEQRTA